jgi:lysophospholipase L1-like esterase
MRSMRLSWVEVAGVGLWALAFAAGCGSSESAVGGSSPETGRESVVPAFSPGNTPDVAEAAAAPEPPPASGTDAPAREGPPSATLPLEGGGTGAGSAPTPAAPEAPEAPAAMTPPAPPPSSMPAPTPPTTNPADLPRVTMWIAGDSTVANGLTPCPRGWGAEIGAHFDQRVTVTNSAVGGRSVHTWLYMVGTAIDPATRECSLARDAAGTPLLQPRWQAMLDGMHAGDYLFIQFGINDGDPTCDRHVGLDAFETAYGMMADAAKARGAQPVFLTPVSSISCNGTTARGSRGAFVTSTLDAGQRFGVPVIDLHARSVELYNEHGFCPVAGGDVSAATTGPVGNFFCDDHTHFSPTGAVEIADLVVAALREQNIGLAGYLK